MNITEEAEYFIELPAKQNKLYVNYDIEENISIDAIRVTRFTEAEIKSIDERYWPFAVPVDGSVGVINVKQEKHYEDHTRPSR